MAMSRGAEVFHAVVSVLAAVTAMVMRDAPDGFRSALSVGILHHRALAIKHLRERLSRPQAEADDGAIITIVFLKVSRLKHSPRVHAFCGLHVHQDSC